MTLWQLSKILKLLGILIDFTVSWLLSVKCLWFVQIFLTSIDINWDNPWNVFLSVMVGSLIVISLDKLAVISSSIKTLKTICWFGFLCSILVFSASEPLPKEISNLEKMMWLLSHLLGDADFDVVQMMTQLFLGQSSGRLNLWKIKKLQWNWTMYQTNSVIVKLWVQQQISQHDFYKRAR